MRSCIGKADDLLAGKSYYIVEVEALLELRASDGTAPHLFLFDELFRGTNAVERIAAGQAVLVELLQARRGAPTPHVALAARAGDYSKRFALLRLHGAPETLLAQAVTTAEMLDRQRGTTLVAR